jgi:hypothetical protein
MPIERLDIKSRFFIDERIWRESGRDLRAEVYDSLCAECREMYSLEEVREVDSVDPETGQVRRVDALWDCAMHVCGPMPDYVSPRMPLQRAIFRALIAAGNRPQTPEELHARIRKGTPQVILRELTSPNMAYEGIVPV